MAKGKSPRLLQESEYVSLAEFRYQLRRFLRHMEEEVRGFGVNPQQYQLVLGVKGLPKDQVPTISRLAERMQLNHNSMVELVDRCEERSLLRRVRAEADRRQVTLSITTDGEALLRKLGSAARLELRSIGPVMVDSVIRLLREPGGINARQRQSKRKAAASRKAGS
jgi:DNA-binding MarR family transcriptional regulator